MAANKGHEPERSVEPDLTNPADRHDHSEVSFKAITKFGVALTLLCIFSFVFLIYVFRHFLARESALQAPRPAAVDTRKLPPEPRLQATPIPDLKTILDGEQAVLNSYGWVDRGKGVVRIPVKQAMELLAQRGLPARAAAPPAASDASVPTESALSPKMMPPGGPLAGELAAAPTAAPQEAKPAAAPAAAAHEKKH